MEDDDAEEFGLGSPAASALRPTSVAMIDVPRTGHKSRPRTVTLDGEPHYDQEDVDRPQSVAFADQPRTSHTSKPNTAAERPASVAMIDVPRTGHKSRPRTVTLDGEPHYDQEDVDRPQSVAFADQPRTSHTSKPNTAAERPASVAMIDVPRTGHKSRPRTVTLDGEPHYDQEDVDRPQSVAFADQPRTSRYTAVGGVQDEEEENDISLEKKVKDRLQAELAGVAKRSVGNKESAGKELVLLEQQPEHLPTSRVATAGTRTKPGTARESRSRGRSQQKSRGLPGTIGILWKEAFRPVVPPTTADPGYRHVLTVNALVPGGAAERTGRIKVGDKLIAVQDADQQNRKVLVGLTKEEVRKALHGDAGIAISLELLHATDMGAKKVFIVPLVRTPKVKSEATKLPQIGKKQPMPNTPSIKQNGWAKGVRLQGNLAPGEGDLKDYAGTEEERAMRLVDAQRAKTLAGQANADASFSGEHESEGDDELAAEQERLKALQKLKVSDKLTNREKEQLEVMKKHKQQLDEEAEQYRQREIYLRSAIHACEEELWNARELFCDIARRATGNPLDPEKCLHKNHGAVHSLQMCMQEFRPIMDEFLTKIEKAPAFLPPEIAKERENELQERPITKEAARELRDMHTALKHAEERQEKRISEMSAEVDRLTLQYEEEKQDIKAKTDEEIAELVIKVQMREKQIEELKKQIEEMRDELDNIIEMKDVEEIKLRLLQAEAEGDDTDENKIKKAEVCIIACRGRVWNQYAIEAALKDAGVRAQIEVLKNNEAILEEEVERLRAAEDKLHEEEKVYRKFRWSVMINVSKVDPDEVKSEEKRQKAGDVEDDEIVAAVQDYINEAPDDAEIFVGRIQDYVRVRFPFLDLTDKHKQLIADTFEDMFKEVPPPTEEELKELERQRLEDEAIDYGYTTTEATGRTAGQLRKLISEAKAASKAAKDSDRKKREAAWGDDDEKEPVDSDDSDAVYKSDNPASGDEEDD